MQFKFKVGNPATGAYTIEALPIGTITDTNVHRVTVQLDMGGIPQTYNQSTTTWSINNYTTVNNPTASAWLDGAYVSSVSLSAPLGHWQSLPSSGPGSYQDGNNNPISYLFVIDNPAEQLGEYQLGAFQLGTLGNGMLGTVSANGVNSTQQHVDWTYCGFAMFHAPRYLMNQGTLTRVDNGQQWVSPTSTPWDSWRYFITWNGTSGFECCLPLTDNPDDANLNPNDPTNCAFSARSLRSSARWAAGKPMASGCRNAGRIWPATGSTG